MISQIEDSKEIFSEGRFTIEELIRAKIRVVQARNDLSDLALELATRPIHSEKVTQMLKTLLQLSGDTPFLPDLKLFLNEAWPIILLYMTTPLTIAIFRAHVVQ